MATREQIYQAIRNADAAGDSEAVQKLGAYLNSMPKVDSGRESYNPTDNMSALERGVAGAGAGAMHVVRGLGQLVGAVSQQDIDEARKLEEPLMATTGGKVGNVIGSAAALTPTVLVPGSTAILGDAALAGRLAASPIGQALVRAGTSAGGVGAATGALTTEGGLGDRAIGAATGLVGGPAGVMVGRGIGALHGLVRSSVQPFFRSGQESIAGNVLARFAGDNAAGSEAVNALQAARPLIPGTAPTIGEVGDNVGLAQLERTLRMNAGSGANPIADRIQANRDALVGAVEGLAGDPQRMAAAVAARDAASRPLYAAADTQNVIPPEAMRSILNRPSTRSALAEARRLADERGESLVIGRDIPASVENTGLLDASGNAITRDVPAESAAFTGRGLHYLKMGMDQLLTPGNPRGFVGAEADAVRATRAQLLAQIESAIPDYAAARQAYAAGSAPINQMEVGQEMLNKVRPALADYGADSRSTPAIFAKALRDDTVAARATGMPNATLESTLTPDQFEMLQNVARSFARRAVADESGRIPGSPTAQNMVSQNILRQVLGPMGLPETAAENALVRTLMRAPQFAAQYGERDVMNVLSDAAIDPQYAARLLQRGIAPDRAGNALEVIPMALRPIGQASAASITGP